MRFFFYVSPPPTNLPIVTGHGYARMGRNTKNVKQWRQTSGKKYSGQIIIVGPEV